MLEIKIADGWIRTQDVLFANFANTTISQRILRSNFKVSLIKVPTKNIEVQRVMTNEA